MHPQKVQVIFKQRKPTAKERFLAENVKYAYELELNREGSIVEQTGKMLVYQSLFTAALYAALPSVLSLFEKSICATTLVWLFSAIVTVLIILGLVVTLAAQGRYKYYSLPNIDETKITVNKLPDCYSYEQIICTFNEKYISLMYKSLEKNNNLRCKLLKVSMCLFYITLGITLIMIVTLAAI